MPRDDGTRCSASPRRRRSSACTRTPFGRWTDAGRLTAYRINSRGDRRFRRGDVERILVEDAPAGDDDARHRPSRAGRERRAGRSSSASPTGLATTPSPGGGGPRPGRGAAHRARTSTAPPCTSSTDEPFELLAHAGFRHPPPSGRAARRPSRGGRRRRSRILARRPTRAGRAPGPRRGVGRRMSPPFLRASTATVATALASSRLLVRARRELTPRAGAAIGHQGADRHARPERAARRGGRADAHAVRRRQGRPVAGRRGRASVHRWPRSTA